MPGVEQFQARKQSCTERQHPETDGRAKTGVYVTTANNVCKATFTPRSRETSNICWCIETSTILAFHSNTRISRFLASSTSQNGASTGNQRKDTYLGIWHKTLKNTQGILRRNKFITKCITYGILIFRDHMGDKFVPRQPHCANTLCRALYVYKVYYLYASNIFMHIIIPCL